MTLQRVAQTVGAPSESCRMLTAYLPGATPSSCDSAEYPAFPAASESTDRATSARARPPSARSAYAFSVPSKTTATEKGRSEEHTSELQSLMRNTYAVY